MNAIVPVTDADRKAAALFQREVWGDRSAFAERMEDGDLDHHPMVQAFARHHLNAGEAV